MKYKRAAKAFFSFLLGLISSTAGGVFYRMVENGYIRAKFKISGDIGVKNNKNEKKKPKSSEIKKSEEI